MNLPKAIQDQLDYELTKIRYSAIEPFFGINIDKSEIMRNLPTKRLTVSEFMEEK